MGGTTNKKGIAIIYRKGYLWPGFLFNPGITDVVGNSLGIRAETWPAGKSPNSCNCGFQWDIKYLKTVDFPANQIGVLESVIMGI